MLGTVAGLVLMLTGLVMSMTSSGWVGPVMLLVPGIFYAISGLWRLIADGPPFGSTYRRVAWTGFAFCALWAGWLILTLLYRPVHFVLPDGFTGHVLLIKDNRGVRPRQRWSGPEYTIPATGVLLVRNFAPFERIHREAARFASGVELPVRHGSPPRDKVTRRLLDTSETLTWCGGSTGWRTRRGRAFEHIEYYVGPWHSYKHWDEVLDPKPSIERVLLELSPAIPAVRR